MSCSKIEVIAGVAAVFIVTLSARVNADPIKINIPGSSVVASSVWGNRTADLVTDGNPNTEWNSGGYSPAWIMLDLGRPMPVGKIRLLPDMYPYTTTTASFTVSVGADQNSMRNVYALSPLLTDNVWYEVGGDGGNGDHLGNVRYVKITTTSDPTWVAWREIEVYGGAEYFGYFNDSVIAGQDFILQTTAAGANLVHIQTHDMVALLSLLNEAKQHSAKALIDLKNICWNGARLLVSPQGEVCPGFDLIRDTIKSHGYESEVATFYLQDEPYDVGCSQADLTSLAKRIRGDFPSTPLSMIEAQRQVPGLTVAKVAMFDWVGFDCYGDWSAGCYGYSIPTLISMLRNVLSKQQRMIAVPNSAVPHGGDISITAQNAMINNNLNHWHQEVLSDAKYIAVIPYLWSDPAENVYGAGDMPWLKERLYQLEASVLPLSDAHVFPMAYRAAGTYSTYYPFAAFNRNTADFWNSGGYGPTWITADLGGLTRITKVVLTLEQDVAGPASHALRGWNPTVGWIPLTTFQGSFPDYHQFEWTGSAEVTSVEVDTNSSPAWVAWRDIQIYH